MYNWIINIIQLLIKCSYLNDKLILELMYTYFCNLYSIHNQNKNFEEFDACYFQSFE